MNPITERNAVAEDPKISRRTRAARMGHAEAKSGNREGNVESKRFEKRSCTRATRRSARAALRNASLNGW